jgi:hypothetical protein
MTVRLPVLTVVPHQIGVEAIRLGDRLVGYVRHHEHERQRYSWMVCLGDWPKRSGPCASAMLARDRIRIETEDWLVSAGIIDAGDRVEMRVDERLLPERKDERARA